MAKKAYIGVNNIAKNVKDIYVKDNGELKEIIKGYVGVNGVAQLFYEKEEEVVEEVKGFWDLYVTAANQRMATATYQGSAQTWTKNYDGIAFYAPIKTSFYGNATCIAYVIVSPNEYGSYIKETNTVSSVTTYRNYDKWYFVIPIKGADLNATLQPNTRLLTEKVYADSAYDISSELINDFLNQIYSNCYAENYQRGQTYNLVTANISKFIRRFIGIFLYKNENEDGLFGSNYDGYYDVVKNLIYQNIETIVNFFTTQAGNHNIIFMGADDSHADVGGLGFYAWYASNPLNNVTFQSVVNYNGNYHLNDCSYLTEEIPVDTYATIEFLLDGTISYESSKPNPYGSTINYVGGYYDDYMYMEGCNIGLVL